MPGDTKAKKRTQRRFDETASAYVTSTVHAEGSDLDMLLDMAQPQPHWITLDVATGGGHTARRFAPYVRQVVAADIAMQMLGAASRSTTQGNVRFVQTDAENLALRSAQFDLVTCRIAAHHFPDAFRFVQESTRVLRPGGVLLIEDHVNTDDERAAGYVDAFERLRDPSHIHAFAGYEWQGMFLDAGLDIVEERRITRPAGGLITWAERQNCDQTTVEKLTVMLAQAPTPVREYYTPRNLGTSDADFDHRYILLAGHKRAPNE